MKSKLLLILIVLGHFVNAQNTTWQWAKNAYGAGAQSNKGQAICLDNNDNSYVTGRLIGNSATQSFSSGVVLSSSNSGVFIVKYNKKGVAIWGSQALGSTNSSGWGNAITTDTSSNIYVTGGFYGTNAYDTTNLTSSGGVDIFITKLDSSGNFLWSKKAGGSGSDEGLGIVTDQVGNVYVTGSFADTAIFDTTTLISNGQRDIFIAKYDSNGNLLWAKKKGGVNYDIAYGIGLDNSGNIFLTGTYQYNTVFDTISLPGNGWVIFVAKFDPMGDIIWANKAEDTTAVLVSSNAGYAIDVDDLGNCYVTGTFQGNATFNTALVSSLSGYDTFIAKYDGNGDLIWVKRAGGNQFNASSENWDHGSGIKVDNLGNCYVIGVYYTRGLFDTTNVYGFNQGTYVAKYNTNGSLVWVKTGGIDESWGKAIAIDNYGNCYVTGYYLGWGADFGPFNFSGHSASSTNIYVAKICANTPPQPTITVSGNTTFCNDSTLTLTSSPGYSYLWSNGDTTQSTVLSWGGNFTVSVINLSGCSATSSSVSILGKASPSINSVVVDASSCSASDGQITTTILGSAPPPFTYLWSNGAITPNITGIPSGVYTLSVTSSNGCEKIKADTLNSNCTVGIAELVSQNAITVYPNPTKGKFKIKNNLFEFADYQLEIYTIFGEKIMSQNTKNDVIEIDLSSQSNGIYFIHLVKNNEIVSSAKVIITN